MVGDGGAREVRKMFINLSSSTFTPINYWENKSITSLKLWVEALSEGDGR